MCGADSMKGITVTLLVLLMTGTVVGQQDSTQAPRAPGRLILPLSDDALDYLAQNPQGLISRIDNAAQGSVRTVHIQHSRFKDQAAPAAQGTFEWWLDDQDINRLKQQPIENDIPRELQDTIVRVLLEYEPTLAVTQAGGGFSEPTRTQAGHSHSHDHSNTNHSNTDAQRSTQELEQLRQEQFHAERVADQRARDAVNAARPARDSGGTFQHTNRQETRPVDQGAFNNSRFDNSPQRSNPSLEERFRSTRIDSNVTNSLLTENAPRQTTNQNARGTFSPSPINARQTIPRNDGSTVVPRTVRNGNGFRQPEPTRGSRAFGNDLVEMQILQRKLDQEARRQNQVARDQQNERERLEWERRQIEDDRLLKQTAGSRVLSGQDRFASNDRFASAADRPMVRPAQVVTEITNYDTHGMPARTSLTPQRRLDQMLAQGPNPTNESSLRDLTMAVPGPQGTRVADNIDRVAGAIADNINNLANGNQAPVTDSTGQALNQGQTTFDIEERQRAERSRVLLLTMLLASIGLNVYLAWISRGFYVRYHELADELRETFTAAM